MKTLVLLALVGLGAQLVDGSLGMAYGVTSTTLLLAIGTNPAAASATDPPRRDRHDPRVGRRRTGSSATSTGRSSPRSASPARSARSPARRSSSNLSTEVAAPVMSLILLSLGVYLLVRFTLRGIDRRNLGKPMRKRFLAPLGLVAGFVDATGGGGWGPVGTPGAAGQRPHGAAQGHRLDRHLGVPRRAGREPRLPVRARLAGHQRRVGGRPARSAAWSPRRSPRGWSGTSRRGCSARWSAA